MAEWLRRYVQDLSVSKSIQRKSVVGNRVSSNLTLLIIIFYFFFFLPPSMFSLFFFFFFGELSKVKNFNYATCFFFFFLFYSTVQIVYSTEEMHTFFFHCSRKPLYTWGLRIHTYILTSYLDLDRSELEHKLEYPIYEAEST